MAWLTDCSWNVMKWLLSCPLAEELNLGIDTRLLEIMIGINGIYLRLDQYDYREN